MPCSMRVVVVCSILASAPALASPVLDLVEPVNGQLAFGDLPIGVTSPGQRVRVRNSGDTAGRIVEVRAVALVVSGPSFGTLAPGEEASWDVACQPQDGGDVFAEFSIRWCDQTCDGTDIVVSVAVSCYGGYFTDPGDVFLPGVFAEQHSQTTYSIVNREATPVTITALPATAPFTARLVGQTLPATVGPGATMEVLVDFDAAGGDRDGTVDVMSDAFDVGRARVHGFTIGQIQPQSWGFESMPQGAVYTLPMTIRNSSTITRTITSVAFDLPDATLSNVVGTALGPGAITDALATFTATALGTRRATLTVGFDSLQGDSAVILATVIDPVFEVDAGDATPADGRLDFGTVRAGAVPIDRAVTIVNKQASDIGVAFCPSPAPPFELVGCPTTIPANGYATITLRLTPTAAGRYLDAGALAIGALGTIVLTTNVRVVDRAYATATSELAFDGAATQALTIENHLDTPLALPVAVTGDAFRAEPAALAVAPGGTAELTVAFEPPAGGGDFTGTLAIGASDDPDRLVIPLAGSAPIVPPPVPGEDGGGCCQSGAPGASPLLALLVLAIATQRLQRRRRR
jgi:hypothetical protein